jgi:predicted amino acid racemase
MYPRVVINTEKYRHNLKNLMNISHENGISIMGVSKVFCADHKLVNIMIEENVDYIADSRIENLKEISTDIPKVLLRIASFGDAERIVLNSNISLNSELETIKRLDSFSKKHGLKHGVILMIDLGDLREGIFDLEELHDTVKRTLTLDNIDLKGIGTNLTCFGGVIPSTDILKKLVDIKVDIEDKFNITLDIISGGNSSSIDMLIHKTIPKQINNLRLGESIVLGRETAYGTFIEGTYSDVFTLEAEIIELKDKPSVPIGEIGMNAFGKTPTFVDKGIVKRAILAIGKQDVDYKELIPYDTIEIIGSSSDHLIVDVTNSADIYEIGDTIKFKLTYSSILSLMTSKYVSKAYE